MHGNLAGAVADVLCRQLIHAAEKKLHITVAEDLLPLVQRVSVLKSGKVLEHAAHADVSGAYHADFSAEVWNNAAGRQFFTEHMNGDRQLAALAVFVCIAHQLDKTKDRNNDDKKSKVLSWSLVIQK